MSTITYGNARLSVVEELRIPNRIGYFTQDEALIAAHRHWLAPHFLDDRGGFDLVFQSWIIEVDGRVILVDPCSGNGKPHSVSFFHQLDVPWIERIAANGYRPEDVDFVLCTHLHHDHCGWNTRLRDGAWVPTFPKARYVMQRREYDHWAAVSTSLNAADYNHLVFERSVAPVAQAGLVDFCDGARRLMPGIDVEPAPGHTFGHQLVHLETAGNHALFTGDCYHHPIQLVEPAIMFGDVDDPAALIATRHKLVERAVELDAVLIAAHTDAPYGIRITRDAGMLAFSTGI